MAVGRELDYDVNDILGNQSLGGFTDENLFGEDTLDPTNVLLLGATQRTSTAFGRTATVKAGEDIRPALESLKSAGGGTLILLAGVHKPTYNIVGGDGINIFGEGIDKTIIDFGSTNNQIIYDGGATTISRFELKNFTVKSSNLDGIYLRTCQDFNIESVETSVNTLHGFNIIAARYFTITNCQSGGNGGAGFVVQSSSIASFDTTNFNILNCISTQNDAGFRFITNNSYLINGWSVLGCISNSNTNDGFSIEDSSNILDFSLVSCSGFGNTWDFDIAGSRFAVVGCTSSNGGNGIRTDSGCSRGSLLGCSTNGDYNIQGDITVVGLTISEAALSVPLAKFDNLVDTGVCVLGTKGGSTTTERSVRKMINNTGSTINAGEVVILKNVADGDEIATTTTAGDDLVFGMMLFTASSTPLVYGDVLIEGLTNILKVDGTTDIAIGDYLTTFTTAGIAAKATTGDMAFAIALEAYTTDDSNGVIDALIIKPRKI